MGCVEVNHYSLLDIGRRILFKFLVCHWLLERSSEYYRNQIKSDRYVNVSNVNVSICLMSICLMSMCERYQNGRYVNVTGVMVVEEKPLWHTFKWQCGWYQNYECYCQICKSVDRTNVSTWLINHRQMFKLTDMSKWQNFNETECKYDRIWMRENVNVTENYMKLTRWHVKCDRMIMWQNVIVTENEIDTLTCQNCQISKWNVCQCDMLMWQMMI